MKKSTGNKNLVTLSPLARLLCHIKNSRSWTTGERDGAAESLISSHPDLDLQLYFGGRDSIHSQRSEYELTRQKQILVTKGEELGLLQRDVRRSLANNPSCVTQSQAKRAICNLQMGM